MNVKKTPQRGKVVVHTEECKGCGLCVDACPPKGLRLAVHLNHYGVHPAAFEEGAPCTGCGICFYVCPEPGAITVYCRVEEEEPSAESTATA